MTPQQIEQALVEHEMSSRWVAGRDGSRLIKTCSAEGCDWSCVPDGYQGDRHRAHVAQVLASLMPQATETTS